MFIPGDVIDGRLMVMEPIDIENCVYFVLDFQKDSNLYDCEIFCIRSDKEYFNIREKNIFTHDDDMKLLKYLLEATESKATFVSNNDDSFYINTGIVYESKRINIDPFGTLKMIIAGEQLFPSHYFLTLSYLMDSTTFSLKVDNEKEEYDFGNIINILVCVKKQVVAKYTFICVERKQSSNSYHAANIYLPKYYITSHFTNNSRLITTSFLPIKREYFF